MAAAASPASPADRDVGDVPADRDVGSSLDASTVFKQDDDLFAKMRLEMLRRFYKAKWVAITNIYNIISRFGLPYGGAIRDYIARISAADAYYAYCKEKEIDGYSNYNNRYVHRESFADRNLIPNDIDIFITKKKFAELIKILETKFRLKKQLAGYNYFFESSKILKAALTHEKWVLTLFSFPDDYVQGILLGNKILKKTYELSIDFVIINDDYLDHIAYRKKGILYPPFGNPDFDVNLLSFYQDSKGCLQVGPLPYLVEILTPSDMEVNALNSYENNKVIMDSVIANIKNKRAQPIFPFKEQYARVFDAKRAIGINAYRVLKMVRKGYKIDCIDTIMPDDVTRLWPTVHTEHGTEAACSICKELFTNENRAFDACSKCPRKMHLKCFCDFLKDVNPTSAPHNSILCAECGEVSFPEDCPCDLVNFLNKITFLSNKKNWITRTPCTVCRRWYSECKCWFLNCNSCKKTLTRTDAD